MHAFLSDRKLVFDTHYRRFFFVDEHPEIAARFQMTFESCFRKPAAPTTVSVEAPTAAIHASRPPSGASIVLANSGA
jgi:hypothetical protein